ncbi:hypothetical protein [Clostridium fermenticellae]|uniref:hypothetical protein n=1 Tax=Clostridium fermenticellae TaxID=2068654 RepID=UPI0013C5344D|nr:hypothetical protein [Clostridium fermenticellae]
MEDEEREYPIVIDPTVITEQNKESIFDSYVSSAAPTTNYTGDVILKECWSQLEKLIGSFL